MLTAVLPAPAWCALAGAIAVSALPSPAWVRVSGLVQAGRLAAAEPGIRDGWAVPLARRGNLLLVAGAMGLVVGALLGGPPVSLGAAAVAVVVALLVRDLLRGRRESARRHELLSALRLLLADLEAGAASARALTAAGEVCPGHPELAAAAGRAREGRDVAGPLLGAHDPHVRALGLAWRVGASTGAALADLLGRVAADLAELDTQRRAVAVAVAGPRASAALLAGLPALGLVLGAAMGARPLHFLLAEAAGRVVCGAGLVLDAVGLAWIRRILVRAER